SGRAPPAGCRPAGRSRGHPPRRRGRSRLRTGWSRRHRSPTTTRSWPPGAWTSRPGRRTCSTPRPPWTPPSRTARPARSPRPAAASPPGTPPAPAAPGRSTSAATAPPPAPADRDGTDLDRGAPPAHLRADGPGSARGGAGDHGRRSSRCPCRTDRPCTRRGPLDQAEAAEFALVPGQAGSVGDQGVVGAHLAGLGVIEGQIDGPLKFALAERAQAGAGELVHEPPLILVQVRGGLGEDLIPGIADPGEDGVRPNHRQRQRPGLVTAGQREDKRVVVVRVGGLLYLELPRYGGHQVRVRLLLQPLGHLAEVPPLQR